MKQVGPIRKELGVKTFFNMLGPMVNPAFPRNQLVGVFNLELARMYGYLYQKGDKQYSILHAMDGYDEISLTGATKVISNHSERELKPADLGLRTLKPEELYGGSTVQESAAIFMQILNGNGTEAQRSVVCANAAMAIATVQDITVEAALEKAETSLQDGKALASLTKLQALSNQYASL